jgi:diaminopimelate decarboxylase
MNDRPGLPADLDPATRHILLHIARTFGTPTYAFDIRQARAQVARLRAHLPPDIRCYYSLKANASLGLCQVFEACGLGADVASAGELATAIAAGFPGDRIFVAGPFKTPETLASLRDFPQAVLSVDSPSELSMLAERGLSNPLLLRLRPDFGSSAVVSAGCESRFGFTMEDLQACRDLARSSSVEISGFHVFAGSQVLSAARVIDHLRGALQLCRRAAETLDIVPALFNLGGGFGIPYAGEPELDLAAIGDELATLQKQARPAQVMLELGRYFVAQSGWYLTSVLGHQSFQGRRAVVVDGGTHQRADLCGLCLRSKALPPFALDAPAAAREVTAVLGCLSLPADVMSEASPLPPLSAGDVLAYPNAGAYGVWSSPALFHGSPLPAEIAFDGDECQVMRDRRAAASILEGQRQLIVPAAATAQPGIGRLVS